MTNMSMSDDHALSFGAAAHDYDRARPTYPDVALAASRSYVIVRPEPQREQVLSTVRDLGNERAGVDGLLRLPYETWTFRYDLV